MSPVAGLAACAGEAGYDLPAKAGSPAEFILRRFSPTFRGVDSSFPTHGVNRGAVVGLISVISVIHVISGSEVDYVR